MALFKNRKYFCLGTLLLISSLSYASSNQNIYIMTLSIMSYVNWSNSVPNFCIIDNPSISNEFAQTASSKKFNLNILNATSSNLADKNCDAIFFTKSSPLEEQKIINASKIPPALSFSTNNVDCEIGSTFCLFNSKAGKSSFRVNLDSLAKTKVHIDPRVLLLAKRSE